jgi:hypothetical protein
MRPEERPWDGTDRVKARGFVPIERRPTSVWNWKADPYSEEAGLGLPTATPSREKTYTRADFLFAYWLARAGGGLEPGPGASPAGRAGAAPAR